MPDLRCRPRFRAGRSIVISSCLFNNFRPRSYEMSLTDLQPQSEPQSGVNIRLQTAWKRSNVFCQKRAVKSEKLGNIDN